MTKVDVSVPEGYVLVPKELYDLMVKIKFDPAKVEFPKPPKRYIHDVRLSYYCV